MKKILIVENEKTDIDILTKNIKSFFNYLNIDNFKIDFASNGYEAFGMHYHYNYDLIILDTKIPKCDGIKFLTLLRNDEIVHQALVSMIIDSEESGFINLYKQKGANSFLFKPYDESKIHMILGNTYNLIVKESDTMNSFENDSFEFDFEDDFIDDVDNHKLSKANDSHLKLPAKEFLAQLNDIDLILKDVEKLDPFLENIILNLSTDNFSQNIDNIIASLKKYSSFLDSLSTFKEISSSLTSISEELEKINLKRIDDKRKSYITNFTKSILEDLQNWKDFVFIQKTAHDVFYINASILSNSIQLKNLINKEQ